MAALVPEGGAEKLPMNEAIVFKNVSQIKGALGANPRRSVHRALSHPEDWGQVEIQKLTAGGTRKQV